MTDKLTIAEVSKLTGYHKNTVSLAIKRGNLKAEKFGQRVWQIDEMDMWAWMDSGLGCRKQRGTE
jgi:excisionase family DNA binding protein